MAKGQPRVAKYLSVRDFDKLQHYKDRALIWIKLYVTLLDDYELQQLPDETKYHYIGLLLLAARMGNQLPNDAAYLSRQIGASTSINLEILLQRGCLIPYKRKRTKAHSASEPLAEMEQAASAEQMRTEQNREEKRHTTTDKTAQSAPVVGVSKSKFSRDQIRRYVHHCRDKGQAIRSVEGLVTSLRQSGEADEAIDYYLNPHKAPKARQANPNCPKCLGGSMEVVSGKGARKCPDCFPSHSDSS
ncbi:MAG TPA: hypothetical protein VJ866_13255 [Pyrinomonadaceae bacterium]|nr:hypothetical protein [Pyrinomonadaceae bacterium]